MEQAEGIHEDASVLPFAVDDPVDDHAFDGDVSAGGRDSHEGALMGAVPGEAGHDLLARGDLLLSDPLLVREGREGDGCEELFCGFTAGALSWDGSSSMKSSAAISSMASTFLSLRTSLRTRAMTSHGDGTGSV